MLYTALLFVAALAAQVAPGAPPLHPRNFTLSSTRVLEVPAFGFYGNPGCDMDGNLFFHADNASYSAPNVLKIDPRSSQPTTFRGEGIAAARGFRAFSVTPKGRFWMLADSPERSIYALEFSSSGEVTSRTTLELHADMIIFEFAVADSGTMLVGGSYNQTAPENLRGKRFVALYAPSGKLVRDLKSSVEDLRAGDGRTALHEGNASFADGFLYLLQGKSILVLSETGELVRSIKIQKPDPKSVATKIAVSGGLVAIWLVTESNSETIRSYLLVDNATGETIGYYTPLAETGKTALCYNKKEGFTFFKIDAGRVKITTAMP